MLIDRVVLNGWLYLGSTLEVVWPQRSGPPTLWWMSDHPQYRSGTSPSGGVPDQLHLDR